MKHAKFFKYSLLTALLLGAVQSLSAQEATPTGPRKAARYSALLKAKNLVVTTNGQTPKKFYYLVSANDILKLRMLKENDADYITFGPDTFLCKDIQSMRFMSLPRIYLNEDSTTHGTNYAVEHGLLVLRRSFRTGGWNTLVMPVDLNGSQVRELFGEETQLARVRGAEGEDVITIEFDTIDLTTDDIALSANTCYLIRPTREPDVEPTRSVDNVAQSGRVKGPLYMLPNVSLKAQQSPSMSYIRNSQNELVVRMRGSYVRLDNTVLNERGRIVNKKLEAGTWSFNDDGIIVENTDSTLLPAFSCWFQNINTSKRLRFVINGVEDDLNGTATGIVTALVGQRTTAGELFDLQGRRVATLLEDENPQALGLPRGIYILNGKKVFIK